MEIEKHIQNGMVSILYSPGFGAGWSTWGGPTMFLIFDKGLVALAKRGASAAEAAAYIEEKLGEDAVPYMGGWRDIAVTELPVGTRFTISEYDGSESVETIDELTIIA